MNDLQTQEKQDKDTVPAPTVTQLHRQRISHSNARRLSEAIGHSQDMLFSATTVFPFTLFPGTITVDREKVTVVNRWFFRVAEIVSIRIEDILNVTADVGPFFGALKIQTRFFDRDIHSINFLRRNDALKLKRLLQGYVIASKKEIDCDAFTADELAKLLDEIGQGHPSKDM